MIPIGVPHPHPLKTKTHNKSGDGSTHKSWLTTQEAITLKVEIKFKLKTHSFMLSLCGDLWST